MSTAALKRFRLLRAKRSAKRAPPTAIELAPVPVLVVRPELPPLPGPEEVLEAFLGSRAEDTLRAYKRDLTVFAKHLGTDTRGATGLLLSANQAQANALVFQWLNAMAAAGLSTATRARRLSAIKSFVKQARKVGAVTWTLDVDAPHVETYIDTRGPTREEILKLYQHCGEGLEGLRNRVIVGLLVKCGLRRKEVAERVVKDYDRAGQRIRVVGKGNRVKWIKVPPRLVADLEAWWAAAGVLEPEAPIVHALTNPGAGDPLSRDGLNYIVNVIGERAGVRVWPHALRHSAITQGFKNKKTIPEMQAFSRHVNVQTLMRYYDNAQDLGGDVADSLDDLDEDPSEEKK